MPSRHPHSARARVAGLALVAFCLLAVADAVPADPVYVWTDRYGVTHMSQEAPPAGAEARRISLPGGGGSAPSARLERIRCRDFRGALEQLDALDDVSRENRRWLAARERARQGIRQWCDG